ncbi:Transcription factor MafG [Taenia solium]|eukprot:TsM_000809300 transcript=TsM_000809300 gene=TsM_000809300
MAQKYPTDEELVQMTTMQLRSLLEQHIISQEQHRELRTRRRRLQNRKYARRCAKKKQTEVAELAAAAKKESSAIRSLRQQLSRLNTSVDRLDRQIDSLAKLRISMTEAPFSLRMVAPDGTELGLAHFNSHHLPLLSCERDESVSMAAANHFIPRICFKTKPLMQRNLCLGKSATTTAATVSTMRVPVPPAGGACGSSVEGQEV